MTFPTNFPFNIFAPSADQPADFTYDNLGKGTIDDNLRRNPNVQIVQLNGNSEEEFYKDPVVSFSLANHPLRELRLMHFSSLKDFTIKNMSKLEVLDLTGCTAIEDLQISNTPKLKEIRLSASSKIDPDVLARALSQPSIVKIFLKFHFGFKELTLHNLPCLEELHVRKCGVGKSIILSDLPSLRDVVKTDESQIQFTHIGSTKRKTLEINLSNL